MSKSNIALAIIAGAVIGGIVAIVLKAEKALDDEEEEDEYEETAPVKNQFENIAQQFSEKISSELQAAESKIKSAVKKDPGFMNHEGEFGVFL